MTEKERCEIKVKFAEKALQDATRRVTDCDNQARQKGRELSDAQTAWTNQQAALTSAMGTLERERARLQQEAAIAEEIYETANRDRVRQLAKEEAQAKGLVVA